MGQRRAEAVQLFELMFRSELQELQELHNEGGEEDAEYFNYGHDACSCHLAL